MREKPSPPGFSTFVKNQSVYPEQQKNKNDSGERLGWFRKRIILPAREIKELLDLGNNQGRKNTIHQERKGCNN